MKSKARAVKEEKSRLSKTQEVLYAREFSRANKTQQNIRKS